MRTLVGLFVDCIGRLNIKKPPPPLQILVNAIRVSALSVGCPKSSVGFCHVLLGIDGERFGDCFFIPVGCIKAFV